MGLASGNDAGVFRYVIDACHQINKPRAEKPGFLKKTSFSNAHLRLPSINATMPLLPEFSRQQRIAALNMR